MNIHLAFGPEKRAPKEGQKEKNLLDARRTEGGEKRRCRALSNPNAKGTS